MRLVPETYIVFVGGEPLEAFGYRTHAEARAEEIRAAFKTAGHDVAVETYKACIPDLMRVLEKISPTEARAI